MDYIRATQFHTVNISWIDSKNNFNFPHKCKTSLQQTRKIFIFASHHTKIMDTKPATNNSSIC